MGLIRVLGVTVIPEDVTPGAADKEVNQQILQAPPSVSGSA